MLFYRPQALTARSITLCTLLLVLPSATLAEPSGNNSKGKTQPTQDALLAQLAEDENVEDVERSEPLQDAHNAPPSEDAPPVKKTKPKPKAKTVAPNIDLKEVAPAPTPEPPKNPASGDSSGDEVQVVDKTPEGDVPAAEAPVPQASQSEAKEPLPANNLVLLDSEV